MSVRPDPQDLKSNLEFKRRDNLHRLFNPRSIVVIGASADDSKAGSQALRSLKSFRGQVMTVHPRESSLQGYPCYRSVEELPAGVDLAILAIPAKGCVDIIPELAKRGVGGVFVISGGFGEAGEQGAELQRELANNCELTGLRLLGPNTSGFIAPHIPLIASFVPGVDQLEKGRIAVIAQSGGVNLSIAFLLESLGSGVSLAVGLGNAIDVSSADLLEMLVDDPNTHAIALHLEGVTDGRRLYEVLRLVTPRKPVVALVAGKADIGEFAVSHTGNLLGTRQRTVSALVQAGAVVVDTTEQLAQAATYLSLARFSPKPATRVGLITGQAGPGLLIADSLKFSGIELPELEPSTIEELTKLLPPMTFLRNPIDTGRPGETFSRVVETVAKDPNVDAVLVFGLSEPSVLNPVEALLPAIAIGKPVAFGTLGPCAVTDVSLKALRNKGIISVLGPERLALVATTLASDARAQHLIAPAALHQKKSTPPLKGKFDESQAKNLLLSYDVQIPNGIICTSDDAALEAFKNLKKPLVAKIAANDVAHKTEAGGVVVGISEESHLLTALKKFKSIVTNDPGRVLIEEMADKGVELIVGGTRDPSWGPIVMVGLGGIFAEALADTVLRLAPLSVDQATDMLDSLRGKQILDGFRDLPILDREAVINVIIAISRILCEHSEISEIEINPLRVLEHGAIALDALVVIQD